MAGKRVFGHIRRLSSGRWQASYLGPNGGRHNAHSTYVRKGDAEAWLSDEERLIDEGRWTPPADRRPNQIPAKPPLTVEEYVRAEVSRRATRKRKPLKPSTVSNYLQGQRLVVFPALGDILLVDLTAEHIEQWWRELPDNPSQNASAYAVLRGALQIAVADKLIPENPCALRDVGKPEPAREGRALTSNVVVAYLAAVEDRYRALLGILLWCSQRSGEGRAIRRRDASDDGAWLDIGQGVTRVAHEDETGRHGEHWHFDTPKTAAGRRGVAVPAIIVPDVKAAIDAHDKAGRGPDDLLFPALNGRDPISDSTLRKAHNRALKRIGMEGVTMHDLRRTGATLAGQSGATIKELMRRLGHTKPDVAMIYQVADDERDREVAARMAQLVPLEGSMSRWAVQVTARDGEVVVSEVEAATLAQAVAEACWGVDAVAVTVEEVMAEAIA